MTKMKMDSNPTKIPWPSDKWGFTRELRKAVKTAAARVKGDAEKKKLLMDTIDVAIEFLEVNFHSGAKTRANTLKRMVQFEKAAEELVNPKKQSKAKDKTKAPVLTVSKDQLGLFEED